MKISHLALLCTITAIGFALMLTATPAMLGGEADGLLFTRNMLGGLLGSISLWSTCAFLVGKYSATNRLKSATNAAIALVLMVLVHLVFCVFFGVYGSDVIQKLIWVPAALVVGAVMGLIGHMSQKDPLAVLVLSVGFILEPFLVGYLPARTELPWPTYRANIGSSIILIGVGVITAVWALLRAYKGPSGSSRASGKH